MDAEVHAEDAVLARRPQSDIQATKRLAEVHSAVLEADPAHLVDFAHVIRAGVFDRRQLLRKGSWARSVTLARRRQAERLMGPIVIVDLPPAIESALAFGEIAQAVALQQLGIQGPMESLCLPCLWGCRGRPCVTRMPSHISHTESAV